jgi:hypothetical protein
MVRIVIGNIPEDSTDESIREALSAFAPVEAISIARESSPPTAVIELSLSRVEADALAKRIRGRSYRGRTLTAFVPAFGWE